MGGNVRYSRKGLTEKEPISESLKETITLLDQSSDLLVGFPVAS